MENPQVPDKPRNTTVDVLRGIAVIMVLLGHVCTSCTPDYYDSLLANVIWSLQIPLFMLTSGYCMRYSKPLKSARELLRYMGKRCLALLIPWILWVALTGILRENENLVAFWGRIIYNMDSVGYWFLFSLWTITMLFAVASYLSNKLGGSSIRRIVACVAVLLLGAGLLTGIGQFTGFTFLGMKLTVYYIPQFAAGYLFGQMETLYAGKSWFEKCRRWATFPALLIYAAIIFSMNLYYAETTVINLALRFLAAISGTIVLISVVQPRGESKPASRQRQALTWAGSHSMELYTVHSFFMTTIVAAAAPIRSLNGFLLCFTNFALMLLFTLITIRVLSANRISRMLLFGKR